MKRRDFLSLLGGAVAAWPQRAPAQTTPQAAARNWPQRVVRIIVPYAPGGGTDAIARILQAGLSKCGHVREAISGGAGIALDRGSRLAGVRRNGVVRALRSRADAAWMVQSL